MLQQLVSVDGDCPSYGLRPHPECLQQPQLFAVDERLIRHQRAVKGALLVVAPNLGGDGLGISDCYRVTPEAQAIDEVIRPINPPTYLEAAVVVA